MKRIFFLFALAVYTSAAFAGTRQETYATDIVLTNELKIARTAEVVEIPYSRVATRIGAIKNGAFRVVNRRGEEVPHQLVYKGQSTPQALLVQVSIPASGSLQLAIVPGTPKAVVAKTFGRYVPERADDFAWENDKVAFRMYGKALEAKPSENANGMDVWAKRTSALVINKWYKLGNYHKDNGEGLDYYHVGYTLGAGNIAPMNADTIVYPKNYRNYKILDSGALRISFELSYDNWNVGGTPVTVVKRFTLDAGSQMNKVEAQFSYDGNKALPVAVGIIRRAEPGTILLNEKEGIMGYWEPQHGDDGTIGAGCIFTTPVKQMGTDKVHLLTVSSTTSSAPFVYYNGAAWNKAGAVTNDQQWFTYLQEYAAKIKSPVRTDVK
ncbi:DUF4861 domain-containing protein [Chitinophaga horti]|uniref:DUF4861 domain-containing protein n=1 Tax=Chitinophaga horti TaxID=2920382 RepID=A0ABY6IZH8_9BACT|nr:DUF4861 family protein [Chitinophaga horti]UYQ91807.1 DUF4861 domain-containing protein [Chitinophaga horti]